MHCHFPGTFVCTYCSAPNAWLRLWSDFPPIGTESNQGVTNQCVQQPCYQHPHKTTSNAGGSTYLAGMLRAMHSLHSWVPAPVVCTSNNILETAQQSKQAVGLPPESWVHKRHERYLQLESSVRTANVLQSSTFSLTNRGGAKARCTGHTGWSSCFTEASVTLACPKSICQTLQTSWPV